MLRLAEPRFERKRGDPEEGVCCLACNGPTGVLCTAVDVLVGCCTVAVICPVSNGGRCDSVGEGFLEGPDGVVKRTFSMSEEEEDDAVA